VWVLRGKNMTDVLRWNERYQSGETPWDTGHSSSELARLVSETAIAPCRAIELGCGSGTNALWLAQQGFDVTAVDGSALAIERATQRASAAGVVVRFLVADVLAPPQDIGAPFDFFFDRGCYHAVRRVNVAAYLQTLRTATRAGSLGLVLAGNAREPHDPGPPVVTEAEIRAELGSVFEIVKLREFYFDLVDGVGVRFLAWSCLLRRRAD
jgi:SAM-dependent methyltransferase